MRFLLRAFLSIFLNALALYIVAQLFDSIYMADFTVAILASLVLSIVNMFIKPFIIILTLPFTIFTFGLFLFIINAMMLMLTAWVMQDAFIIDSFGVAIGASIVVSIISIALHKLTATPRR